MEFILPEFEYGKNKIGIYQIWFNEQWFYIGSSKNLRARFRCWKSKIKTGSLNKHLNIKQILPFIHSIRFDILKEYKHPSYLRRMETMYIKTNWDNPYFLNRCPDGDTTKGMRPYNGYIKPIPKLKGIPEYMKPKKVAVFSNDGDLIEITKSKSELERKYKIKHNHVNHIINGERGQPINFKIKMVDDFGNYIEPIKFIKKQKAARKSKFNKPVIQKTLSGEIVSVYNDFRIAAKSIGVSSTYIHHLLKRCGKEWTAKGYIFKYA